jgi:transposase
MPMERLHMNEIREMIYRLRKGEGVRRIGRALGFSRNTVRKYRDLAARHGLLASEAPLPDIATLGRLLGKPPRTRHMRRTVEPLRPGCAACGGERGDGGDLAAFARRTHTGSYSSVRRHVSRVRPKAPEAFCRIETKPGEEAQGDCGSAGLQWDAQAGKRRRAWVFVMTLSWSRHQYVQFVFNQKIETFLACHERAFAWFGGVVGRVVLDNLKAGVLVPSLHDPVLCEPYRRFAQHYGFTISPNRPYTPRHKGKVESGVHYVKRNFLAGQTFADLEALNERGRRWVMEVAGIESHGTTDRLGIGSRRAN